MSWSRDRVVARCERLSRVAGLQHGVSRAAEACRLREGLEALEPRVLLAASPSQIGTALDLPDGVSVSFTGDSAAAQTRQLNTTGGLLGLPSGRDSDFLIFSTGRASDVDTLANTASSQGTDLGADGPNGDTATISFSLSVPASSRTQKLKFDFMFLSEEYPEYVGSQFNDFFSITVNGVEIARDQNGSAISVNNVFFDGSLSTTGTFFDGRTALLTASYTIPSGVAAVDVVISIGDVGDGIYDSAALIDNVRFETSQLVWLNFEGSQVTLGGVSWTQPAFQPTDLRYADNSGRSQIIDTVFNYVRSRYDGLDISFTLSRPTSGDYSALHIGGKDTPLNKNPNATLFGRAQSVDVGNQNRSDVAVVFSGVYGTFYAGDTPETVTERLGSTISHELGHILGLRHVDNAYVDEIMKKNAPRDPKSIFHDRLLNLPAAENWPDGADMQNPLVYLRSVLGTTNGTSQLTFAFNALKNFISKFFVFDLGGTPIYDVQIGTYDPGAVVNGELEADIAPQIRTIANLNAPQHLQLSDFSGGDRFFLIGSTRPGGPRNITTGVLDASKRPSLETAAVSLTADQGGTQRLTLYRVGANGRLTTFARPTLALSPFTSITYLPSGGGTFRTDTGQRYRVALTGPGRAGVILDDPDGNGRGGIAQVVLENTTVKSSLAVTGAATSIGAITGRAIGSIAAPRADLAGAGVTLTGWLGSLRVRNVLNGADVTAAGRRNQATTITLGSVGDGSVIAVSSMLRTFTSRTVGDAEILAPVAGDVTVTGDFSGRLRITDGRVGKAAMGAFRVTGTMADARVEVAIGNVASIRAGGLVDSTIRIGAFGSNLPTSPLQLLGSRLGELAVVGRRTLPDSWSNSSVVVSTIGKLTVVDPASINAGAIVADTIRTAVITTVQDGGQKTRISRNNLTRPNQTFAAASLLVTIL